MDANNVSAIIPFAQKDVMSAFVNGFAPQYMMTVFNFLTSYFEHQKQIFLNATPPRQTSAKLIDMLGKDLITELQKELEQVTQEEFVQPTMRVISAMPKEELAILAEALVEVTARKRKASRDAETVGGPTDVAVISKGDGFVWIKRKHYFDANLNPGWQARYLEGGA